MQHETMSAADATETRAAVTLSGPAVRDAVKLLAGKLVERRNTVPMFGALHFEVTPDGRAILTATDCDVWASLTLSADSYDAHEPGRFCLDAASLHKLLSKAGKLERVRFTDTGEGRVILKAGRSEYKMPALKADEFPLVPISAYRQESGGMIDRAQFLADLAALWPAMNAEESRYYLHGVALQVRELAGRERFAMAATDGYMMAAASRDLAGGFEGWGAVMMPRKAVALTLAADKLAGAGDLTLSRSGTHIAVECGALRMVSKLGEGDYPEWPRALDHLCTPTEGDEPALFPELLPNWPLERTEALQKASAVSIDWSDANGGVIGQSADDAGMIWGAMYLFGNPATGRAYDEKLTVDVAGDREYLVPSTASKIGLSKEQVAALCGDSLWEVIELAGPDGKPRYVSAWCYEQGDSRLLCVGKDGRTPKADAPREYVSREQVAAALAGGAIGEIETDAPESFDPSGREWKRAVMSGSSARLRYRERKAQWEVARAASTPETALPCDAEPAPATHAANAPEIAPLAAPVAAEAQSGPEPIPVRAARLGVTQGDEESNGEFLLRIEALEAALPVASVAAKRTPAHERAVRRAWAERKARREAEKHLRIGTRQYEHLKAGLKRAEHELTVRCDQVASLVNETQRLQDRARLAEQEAAEALAMREQMRGLVAALERRAEAAEAENAELWAEIEKLTAPATPVHVGAIPVRAGGA